LFACGELQNDGCSTGKQQGQTWRKAVMKSWILSS